MGGVLSVGEPQYASLCIECGQCIEKCPQHIDIPEVLKCVVEEMEGPGLEQRIAMAKEIFKKK